MNITEANLVCTLVRAMAGELDHIDRATEAIELLAGRAKLALHTGPDASTIAEAQFFLVDNCRTTS